MATSKTARKPAASPPRTAGGKPKHGSKPPVALTVKVDDQTYIRLCALRATQRRTNQDILQEAVQQYLDKAGA